MTRLQVSVAAWMCAVAFVGGRVLASSPQSMPQAQAQQEHHPAGDAAAEAQQPQMQMMQMMRMHQQMMGEMKAGHDRLEGLIATMKSATGQAKIDAVADVVAAMVDQHASMRERMMGMQCQMMGQMMQHMSGAVSAETQKMMAACPMTTMPVAR